MPCSDEWRKLNFLRVSLSVRHVRLKALQSSSNQLYDTTRGPQPDARSSMNSFQGAVNRPTKGQRTMAQSQWTSRGHARRHESVPWSLTKRSTIAVINLYCRWQHTNTSTEKSRRMIQFLKHRETTLKASHYCIHGHVCPWLLALVRLV